MSLIFITGTLNRTQWISGAPILASAPWCPGEWAAAGERVVYDLADLCLKRTDRATAGFICERTPDATCPFEGMNELSAAVADAVLEPCGLYGHAW